MFQVIANREDGSDAKKGLSDSQLGLASPSVQFRCNSRRCSRADQLGWEPRSLVLAVRISTVARLTMGLVR
jgi:hypothetical protein